MTLIVYSQSRSFEGHLSTVIDGEVSYRSRLTPAIAGPDNIYLVHAPSFKRELQGWLEASGKKGAVIGIAADNPVVEDMLTFTQSGALGYFNSYMIAHHYEQMLRLLSHGQSWFPPELLAQTFDLARMSIQPVSDENPLDTLTKRERDVALAVLEGNSNKAVAEICHITERTVKAHLTQIFKKLQVKDRVALVIYLNQFHSLKQAKASTA